MEPPKKRKYPEHLDIVPLVSSGSCAVMGVAMEAEQTGGLIRGTNIDLCDIIQWPGDPCQDPIDPAKANGEPGGDC